MVDCKSSIADFGFVVHECLRVRLLLRNIDRIPRKKVAFLGFLFLSCISLSGEAQEITSTSFVQFTPWHIILTLFVGVITALSGYIAAYAKGKGERRAVREHLEEIIKEQAQTAAAIEIEKIKISVHALHEADRRNCIFSLATSSQSFLHSMCWYAWTFRLRPALRKKSTEKYDEEAHQLTPQVMGQLALLQILDKEFHDRAAPILQRIFALDVKFGEAIVLSDNDICAAVSSFDRLNFDVYALVDEVSHLFGSSISFQFAGR